MGGQGSSGDGLTSSSWSSCPSQPAGQQCLPPCPAWPLSCTMEAAAQHSASATLPCSACSSSASTCQHMSLAKKQLEESHYEDVKRNVLAVQSITDSAAWMHAQHCEKKEGQGGEHALLLGLGHLLLWGVLEDVGVQAVAHVHIRHRTAGLALQVDILLLDLDHCFGVAAVVALHILLDEVLQ